MEMEQGLYAQLIMLRWEDLKFVATDKNKNESKFKFQGQSARSKCWFDLDFDCIEVNLALLILIYISNLFKAMMIHKILIYSDYSKLQLEIKNVWNNLSFKMMPQSSSIVRNYWIAFFSVF